MPEATETAMSGIAQHLVDGDAARFKLETERRVGYEMSSAEIHSGLANSRRDPLRPKFKDGFGVAGYDPEAISEQLGEKRDEIIAKLNGAGDGKVANHEDLTGKPSRPSQEQDVLQCFTWIGPERTSFKEVEDAFDEWGDGARAVVRVQFAKKHKGNGHFIFARRDGGSIIYEDPQQPGGKAVDIKAMMRHVTPARG